MIAESPLTLTLLPHPASPTPSPLGADGSVEVRLAWLADGTLSLAYHLRGTVDRVVWPRRFAPQMTPEDGLWRHTCCELFLAREGVSGPYREFNFAPDGRWAQYDFSTYRERAPGAGVSSHLVPPRLSASGGGDELILQAALSPPSLPGAVPGGAYRAGLSVVLAGVDGGRSYWALAHAAPEPDFHRRESFIHLLQAPGA